MPIGAALGEGRAAVAPAAHDAGHGRRPLSACRTNVRSTALSTLVAYGWDVRAVKDLRWPPRT